MEIHINTPGVHHLALRVNAYDSAKKFYTETLGFTSILDSDNIFIFMAGNTAIVIRGPEDQSPKNDSFSPFRTGMDHVALACNDEAELERVANGLKEANVWTTGVKVDDVLGKKYVAFKDPDGIKWELYMV
jgi:glyoxylase I family protein